MFKTQEEHNIELANVACEVLTYLLKRRHSAESNALALRLDYALTFVDHDEHGSMSKDMNARIERAVSQASQVAGHKGDK